MSTFRILLVVVVMAAVAGCSGNESLAEVKQQMEAIKQSPRGRIEPPPEFVKQPTYSYSAHQLRSPFVTPKENIELQVVKPGIAVQPDTSRPVEYLEKFSFESLRLGGSMQRPQEPIFAIIVDPEGDSHYVSVGNYIGKNYGRITNITQTRVDIVEIVPDGHGGWVERPRALTVE